MSRKGLTDHLQCADVVAAELVRPLEIVRVDGSSLVVVLGIGSRRAVRRHKLPIGAQSVDLSERSARTVIVCRFVVSSAGPLKSGPGTGSFRQKHRYCLTRSMKYTFMTSPS